MIPTDLYDNYNTALAENDRQAQAALAAVIATLDPADVDGIRDALLEIYPALVKHYGVRAAQVALEFYAAVREAQGVSSWFMPELPAESDMYDETEAIADVRREVGGLYSGNTSLDAFTSTMQGLATKRTMEMADSTLYALANADPANPKVALVPHPGACGWCILIGARGFTNAEKSMDSMRHDGCKCTTVIDFERDNPALEGYDPSVYDAVYQDATRNQKFVDEWNAMSDEERAKYVRRTRDRTGAVKEYVGDWSTYVRNRTVQEMNALLGNTKGSKKGNKINGFVQQADSSTIWRGRWGPAQKPKKTAGSDADMSKRADDILKAMGIR